jgi:hypothetical protein
MFPPSVRLSSHPVDCRPGIPALNADARASAKEVDNLDGAQTAVEDLVGLSPPQPLYQ